MYKILITSWIGTSFGTDGKAVHTEVVDFGTPSEATEAANIINSSRAKDPRHRAILLFLDSTKTWMAVDRHTRTVRPVTGDTIDDAKERWAKYATSTDKIPEADRYADKNVRFWPMIAPIVA